MGKVPTKLVGDAHAYTRSDVPWTIETAKIGRGRLFRYLSGGTRTFGRTVSQEQTRRKRVRFLVVFSALAVVWLMLLIF